MQDITLLDLSQNICAVDDLEDTQNSHSKRIWKLLTAQRTNAWIWDAPNSHLDEQNEILLHKETVVLLHLQFVSICENALSQHLESVHTSNVPDDYHEVKHRHKPVKFLCNKHHVADLQETCDPYNLGAALLVSFVLDPNQIYQASQVGKELNAIYHQAEDETT